MKSFVRFLEECYIAILKENKKEKEEKVDYDYEHAFSKIYNHMIDVGKNNLDEYGGNILKGAVQRGDIMTVIDYLSKEMYNAQNDPTHPLNFNQIQPNDGGLKGGKIKTGQDKGKPKDLKLYEKSYYDKLLNQQYSFLNFIQSKSGRKNFVKDYTANVEGATKVKTQPKYAELTGKDKDTSKVDIRFFDSQGKPKYGLSLKDSKGAVVNSSGAEETKALILLGISDLLDKQVKDGTITPERRNELEQLATNEANKLALFAASTKGMSEEEQRIAVPKMQSYLDDLESKIPGVKRAMSSEAITAKGKFGDADSVDALFSSGRGGGVIEDPTSLADYINQRARLGKGKQKSAEGGQRPATFSGDIKGEMSPDEKPTDSEWLRKFNMENIPAWEKKIKELEPELQDEIERIRSQSKDGRISGDDLDDIFSQDTELKSLKQFMKDAEKAQAQSEKALSKADRELEDANDELEASSVPIDPDTKKPVLRQFRKNIEGHMAADPTSRTSKLNSQRRRAAEVKVTNAQSNRDNVAATHDANVNAVQQAQQQQASQETQPAPQQPQQAPQQVQQPQPTQQAPVEQPPAPQPTQQQPQPQQEPQEPQQQPATQEPQQTTQKQPESEKKKKEKSAAERMYAAGTRLGYTD